MTTKNMFRHHGVRSALLITLLGLLASCIVEPVGGRAYVAAPVVQVDAPVVVVQEDLVYYPSYEIYYDSGARLYWYSRGGVWVSGMSPVGVSVDVLLASPSARMNFRDSPANHHYAVAQEYPRNWQPPGRGPQSSSRGSSNRGAPGRGRGRGNN